MRILFDFIDALLECQIVNAQRRSLVRTTERPILTIYRDILTLYTTI